MKKSLTNLACVATFAFMFAGIAQAQTPVYEWNFNGPGTGSGTPNISGGGGSLVATSPGSFTGTGVSGGANDYAYQSTSASGGAFSSADITGLGSFNQLTVTMWINSSILYSSQTFPANVARLFMIGGTSAYDEGGTSTVNSQQGLSIALSGANGLQLGVGGSITPQVNNVLTNFAANQWVFVALEYDGTSSAFSSPALGAAIGNSSRNGALMFGTTTAGVGSIGGTNMIAFTLADFTTSPGSINFSNNSIAFVGNRSNLGRGFSGEIDDIQVYNQLLTSSQLDAARLGAVGVVPEPASATLLGLGCLVGIAAFRRRHK